MGLFSKKIGPVFLKEASDAQLYIGRLQTLLGKADGRVKAEIEKQIKLAEYGEIGERNVAFELKNSGMDMYVLHDIYLEKGDLSAQIDYLVVTRKHIYIIECKNLIGNIEIDSAGNFVRTYELAGRRVKEGIYSPITQNKRHLQVLKEVRKETKQNFLSKMMFEKSFEETYRSVVVLANPKTYLNMRYAKKEIKQQVIRADQLIAYMKEMDRQIQDYSFGDKEMMEVANYFLGKNVPERADYARKYAELAEALQRPTEPASGGENEKTAAVMGWNGAGDAGKERAAGEKEREKRADDVRREELIKELKKFRMDHSRWEGVKPYYIFNDAQMMDLIEKKPRTKEELLRVSGFGQVKAEKYGEELIGIVRKYRI